MVVIGIYVIFGLVVGVVSVIMDHRASRAIYTHSKRLKGDRGYNYTPEPENPPYLQDTLDAYDNQIEAYYRLLDQLEFEYKSCSDAGKQARIRTKQADTMAKIARISEKAYKLREKVE